MPNTLPIEKATITLVLCYEDSDTPLLTAILKHLDPDGDYTLTSEVVHQS